MVSEGMTITLIAAASGVSTGLVNMALSEKIRGRYEISGMEVLMSMAAVAIGSALGYMFIKSRRQETE